MAKYEKTYFGADDPKKTAAILLDKANAWYNNLETNGYLDKVRTMWASYYGAHFSDFDDGHNIIFGGEQGEIAQMAVNHIRNLAQHMLNMVTSTRPSLQARAVNTDQKSLVQARLANGLLDYYMREKRLEVKLKNAVESAIVLGSGFVKMEWNSMAGESYDFDEETQEDIKEGDVEFTNLSPFDVVFDPNREDTDHDWVVCRSFKNRYDIIAKYPEYEDEILALPSKAELQNYYLESSYYDKTDLICVYEFYHKKTEAMPDGRYLLFLSENVTLLDGPIPYRALPIYRISPSNILGTPFGYTPLFDVLPIQDAINSLYSTILTNQNAFGVQNVVVPRGADVSIESLSGGLNVIEANEQFGEIRPLNLTNTPKEIFEFLQLLEQASETISGINSVTRGNPEASLKSGNALALIQSMSIQFMSGLQQSYVMMVEDVGTGLVNMLKDYARVPRIAMISGISNQSSMKEFSGDDLSQVNRVIVDIGNPLSRTTAGRVEMAEQLLQMGVITTPQDYFSVINTGNLQTMIDEPQSENDLIQKENENLLNGKQVMAVTTDQHALHIKKHKCVIADPDLRFNPELVKATLDHIQEHINLLRAADPDLLSMIQEQPLSPPGGSPANQPMPNVPDVSMQGAVPNVTGGVPTQQAQMGEMPPANLPQPARPPAPFENMPINPNEVPNT